MKGEFVGVDGQTYHIDSIALKEVCSEPSTTISGSLDGGARLVWKLHLHPSHPDFPLAVAALQSLIRPKPTVPLAGVHPGVGLRWCGEEEPFGWVGAGTSRQYLYRFRDGQVEYLSECGEWIHFGVDMDAIFDAGRRYERERG